MSHNQTRKPLPQPGQRDASYPKLSVNPTKEPRSSSDAARIRMKRSAQACLNCRARKIRCNVLQAAPCNHCKTNNVLCVMSGSRRKRRIHHSPLSKRILNAARVPGPSPRPNFELRDTNAAAGKPHVPGKEVVLYHPKSEYPVFIKPPSSRVEKRHLEFLRTEGALSLPDQQSQRAMVEAFAVFAYPYLPIVDLKTLLCPLQEHLDLAESPSIGLLLYQAILYAGSAFVDARYFEGGDGAFASRRAARTEFSRRITLLYDLGYAADDNIEMIQVALIMCSGSETISDWKNSWYWMGQAISLALAISLNRTPSRTNSASSEDILSSEQKLRRRIWGTCYMRDRFLSLGMNRSPRIRDADCTTAPLSMNDFEYVTIAPGEMKSPVSPGFIALFEDTKLQAVLAEICINRLRLSQAIDIVTRVQEAYDRSENEIATAEADGWLDQEFSRAEAALEYWLISLPPSCVYRKLQTVERGSEPVVVNRNHMHMAYHALKYTLHRPRFLPTSPRRRDPTAKLSSDISGARTMSSAIQISLMTQELDRLGLVNYLPVSGVTVIFPAMAISLLEMKTTNTIQQQWAAQRFMTCSKAMEVLKETYQTAEAAMDYLKKALQAASLNLDDVLLAAGRCEEKGILVTDFMETWHPALVLDEAAASDHEILGGFEAYLHGGEDAFGGAESGLGFPLPEFSKTVSSSSPATADGEMTGLSPMKWDSFIGDTEFKGLEQMV